MNGAPRPAMPELRAALPWVALGFGLVLATEPAWRIPLLGFSPGLDEVLLIGQCVSLAP